MTTPQRRITANKPERRRDVSGFDVITRDKPGKPSPLAGGGFADWLTDDEPVAVTIDLHSSVLDPEEPAAGERFVDVQIVITDDEASL